MNGLFICFFVVLRLFPSCEWIFTWNTLTEASLGTDILNFRSEMFMCQLMGIPEALKTCTNLLFQNHSGKGFNNEDGEIHSAKNILRKFQGSVYFGCYAACTLWNSYLRVLT